MKNKPQHLSWLIFHNSPLGHPNSWVPLIFPLIFLPPRIHCRAKVSHPHPFGKGRGGWGCILTCEGAVAVEVKPTSLNRGEGLTIMSTGTVRVKRVRAGVVERW